MLVRCAWVRCSGRCISWNLAARISFRYTHCCSRGWKRWSSYRESLEKVSLAAPNAIGLAVVISAAHPRSAPVPWNSSQSVSTRGLPGLGEIGCIHLGYGRLRLAYDHPGCPTEGSLVSLIAVPSDLRRRRLAIFGVHSSLIMHKLVPSYRLVGIGRSFTRNGLPVHAVRWFGSAPAGWWLSRRWRRSA